MLESDIKFKISNIITAGTPWNGLPLVPKLKKNLTFSGRLLLRPLLKMFQEQKKLIRLLDPENIFFKKIQQEVKSNKIPIWASGWKN